MIENDYELNRLARLKQPGAYPERDPDLAAERRALYLLQVRSVVGQRSQPISLSNSPFRRTMEWLGNWLKTIPRTDRLLSRNALLVILLIAAIFLASSGAALAAAQASQPAELLYPLKLFGEDLHLQLTLAQGKRFNLLLSYSERRIDEIVTLRSAAQRVPDRVANRLEDEIQDLFLLTVAADDQTMLNFLQQLTIHLDRDEQRLAMARDVDPGYTDLVYERLSVMLRAMSALAGSGLTDPAAFRSYLRRNWQAPGAIITPAAPATTPDSQGQAPAGPTPGCESCQIAPSQGSDERGDREQKRAATPDGDHYQSGSSTATATCDSCDPQNHQERHDPVQTMEPAGGSREHHGQEGATKQP
ncbi:MAG TPA: DUF5667 domain-containing protein [Anaerolineales bacterium]|nr:DUF5667 domain-containing protein [Anaerolineales bacterium]